jgi:hypothetical protein
LPLATLLVLAGLASSLVLVALTLATLTLAALTLAAPALTALATLALTTTPVRITLAAALALAHAFVVLVHVESPWLLRGDSIDGVGAGFVNRTTLSPKTIEAQGASLHRRYWCRTVSRP